MIPFTVYDNTGRILRSGICQPDCLDLQAGAGEAVLNLASRDDQHYVQDGAILDRPVMNVQASSTSVPANGVDEVQLTGAPAGAAVTIRGPVVGSGVTDTGDVTLTFTLPGTYEVSFSLFPYQESKVTIHAT